MKEKFIKYIGNNISFEDEKVKKDFSLWIKTLEKEKNRLTLYESILKQEKPYFIGVSGQAEKYLINLYYDLSIMYFHCHISFPLVEITFFLADNEFDSEKMIDFINRGKDRKVNFVILPKLFSDNNYLKNGKYWVFTYTKNTFRFQDSINNSINEILKEKLK